MGLLMWTGKTKADTIFFLKKLVQILCKDLAPDFSRTAPDFDMLPGLTNTLPHCEVMDADQVARIDGASMDILENVGVHFRDDIALADWKATYHARDPEKNVRLGGRDAIFVPMTGAPYLRDLDDVRRNPLLEDLAMFHKLSHMLPGLHSSAHHIVEPYDHPISQRHLRITYSSMKHSDKTFMGMTTSPKNAEDVMEMCAILFGADFMETHPVTTGNCNGNSPFLYPSHSQGGTRDLWALPVDGFDALWGTHGRHARDQFDELHDRANGAVLWHPLAHLEHAWRGENIRRASWL